MPPPSASSTTFGEFIWAQCSCIFLRSKGIDRMFMASRSAERFDDTVSNDDDYFVGAGRGGEADFCSRDGAHALKTKIESYWAERGQSVQVMLHNVGFHPAIRAARFDVRSDMINGMPRTAAQKRAKSVETFVEDFDKTDDDLVFE